MRCLITVFSLCCSMLVAAQTTLTYQGMAYAPGTDTLLYSEHHTLTLENHQLVKREVEYRNANGDAIAQKQNRYNQGATQPEFLLQDQRRDYREQVSYDQGFVMTVQENGKTEQARIDKDAQPLVIDAGFDEFVRQHWATLLAGEQVDFYFAAPARQDVIAFRVIPSAITEQQLQLEMRLQSRWLAWLLDPIQLHYDLNNQRLLRYIGLTNIQDDNGKGIDADIRYQYGDTVHN